MDKKKHISNINAIMKHLETYGVENKDVNKKTKPSKKSNISRTLKNVYRYRLDLHGLSSEEARRSINLTLNSCHQRGIKEVLIIHGKGSHSNVNEGPVLKGLVYKMLEHELHHKIRDFKPAPLKDGGDGATIVYLT